MGCDLSTVADRTGVPIEGAQPCPIAEAQHLGREEADEPVGRREPVGKQLRHAGVEP